MTTKYSEIRNDYRIEAPGLQSNRDSLWPGLTTVMAGTILVDSAIVTAAYRAASSVPDDQLSFPWDGASAVATSLVWGFAQLLLVCGLLAFAKSDAVASLAGKTGQALAIAGSALFVIAHILSVFTRDASIDDASAIAPLTCFGIGTILLAVGMLLAGVATLRAATWTGWRRYTPIAIGLWMLAMIPLQFTAALAASVAVYGLAVLAFGAALIEEAR